jgi:hypothetical protein
MRMARFRNVARAERVVNPAFLNYGAGHGSITCLASTLEALQLVDLLTGISNGWRSCVLTRDRIHHGHFIPGIMVFNNCVIFLLLNFLSSSFQSLAELFFCLSADLISVASEEPAVLFIKEHHPVELILLAVDDSSSDFFLQEHQVTFEKWNKAVAVI